MKIKQLLLLCIVVVLVSCGKNPITSSKVTTELDSLSYAFGVNIFNSLKQDSIVLSPELIAKGMKEAAAGKAFLDNTSSRGYIISVMNKREKAKQQKEAELNKIKYKGLIEQGDSFLKANKEKPGVIVTPSGLQYKVIKMGTGAKPTSQDVVRVNYTGTLINGQKFDSSVDRGKPAEFMLGGVIKGWVEGLQLMPVGSKFTLYIPYDLGYGPNQASEVLKPYSTLIFDVELLEIVKQKK
ncbi:MAG TPA: FKBP-type peptidyl-prolyl cis-trans isomerase [Bacteroidales bacterium]|nr:FKBP-type peptidyl-prolyl cis-trans isomerase [Bacteroidales bacterium]